MVIKVVGRQWAWSFAYPTEQTTSSPSPWDAREARARVARRGARLSIRHSPQQDVVPGVKNYTWFQRPWWEASTSSARSSAGSIIPACCPRCTSCRRATFSGGMPPIRPRPWPWRARRVRPGGQREPTRPEHGEQRFRLKGCVACHTVDGSRLIGPSLKGVFGRRVAVVTAGMEREVVADEDYLARSIRDPAADVVRGFPPE